MQGKQFDAIGDFSSRLPYNLLLMLGLQKKMIHFNHDAAQGSNPNQSLSISKRYNIYHSRWVATAPRQRRRKPSSTNSRRSSWKSLRASTWLNSMCHPWEFLLWHFWSCSSWASPSTRRTTATGNTDIDDVSSGYKVVSFCPLLIRLFASGRGCTSRRWDWAFRLPTLPQPLQRCRIQPFKSRRCNLREQGRGLKHLNRLHEGSRREGSPRSRTSHLPRPGPATKPAPAPTLRMFKDSGTSARVLVIF